MKTPRLDTLILTAALGAFTLAGCGTSSGQSNNDTDAAVDSPDGGSEADTGGDPTGEAVLDPSHFLADGLTAPIEEVPCTLSNGDETTCYKVSVVGEPKDHEIGPFCPRNVSDGPEAAGIWLEGGEVYDADGAFIAGLAEFYEDPNWQLHDEATGVIRVTETLEACEAAARPDVAEEYQNYCVECDLEDLGGAVAAEYLIPKVPVPRATAGELGGTTSVGVALNGAFFDPPAPVAAILGAYTIAAFDDCGGHVNPVAGYHYHAATGCSKEIAQDDAHAPLIGYALDGYAIHSMSAEGGEEPGDLDSCRGHSDDARGYHYHSASPGENMFIGCFHGEVVGTVDDGPGGGGGGGMDVITCDDVPDGMPCCGDDVCDGPETAANCAEDC